MNYYIADTHFGWKNFLQGGPYSDQRPFSSVEEMEESMTQRWNKKVTNADHVYILGDVGKMKQHQDAHYLCKILAGLKGNLHLIIGNHDMPYLNDAQFLRQFAAVHEYEEITDSAHGQARKLFLSHYPIASWEGMQHGRILLYGHTHKTQDEKQYRGYLKVYNHSVKLPQPIRAYNVGCMYWNYEPVSLDEILRTKQD